MLCHTYMHMPQAIVLLLAVQRAGPVLPSAVGVRQTKPTSHRRLKEEDQQAHHWKVCQARMHVALDLPHTYIHTYVCVCVCVCVFVCWCYTV